MKNTVQLSLERHEELRAIERDFKKEVGFRVENHVSTKSVFNETYRMFKNKVIDIYKEDYKKYLELYETEKKAHKTTKTQLIIAVILLILNVIFLTVEFI